MQHKFLKFFTFVILIVSSFFVGKHLIINAQNTSTLSVQESSVPVGGRVTVSWNINDNIGADMNDWIGLFTPTGSQSILFAYPTNMNSDGSPRNCVVTQTGFSVAGSCSFAVFAQGVTVDPGTYQLRYFHRINNVNTKVATSNNFTITSGSSDGNTGSVKIDCAPNSSTCGGAVARVFVPQNGCPSGNDECQNSYKKEVTIPAGSTGVTVTNIPPGDYSTTIVKPGFVSDPPTVPISVGSTGTTTPSVITITLKVDTSEITGFSATPSTINKGDESTLKWQTKDFNVCSIDKGVGSVPRTGSVKVKPTSTTTYTLSCINSAGAKKTKSATVTVNGTGGGTNDPSLTVGSSTVQAGGSINVSWSNIPNPSTKDYILISPHATENDYNWDYLNDSVSSVGSCLNNPPATATASGTCAFTVASAATPGTYTFKYAKYESGTTWNMSFLTSNSFTITSNTGGGGGGTGTGGGGGGGGTGGGTGGTGGTSCAETNLVPTKVDIYKNKPAIFANGYSRSLTLSGTGSNRKLTINQDFGFTSFSLANPSDPTILQHKNMTTNGNPPGGPFSKTGDGQTVVNGLRASLDGSRMIVGWSDVPDDFIVLKDFNGSWEVQAEGDGDTTRPAGIAIVKRTDGKYIGFEYNISGLFAADISDPLPTARGFSNGNDSAAPVFKTYTVPGTSSNPNTPVPQVSSLQQAGNYVAYPGDVDRTNLASMRNGNAVILVDASKPLGSPNISSNFVVKRLSMNDLGIPTTITNDMLSTVIGGFTITASQSDPDVIYLFVDTIKDSVPGAIYAYKISSSGSVVTPLTGSPANPPAPFVGTGVQSGGRPFAYTTANNSRAFFFRKTSSLMGFINATVTGSTLNINVATTPYSSSVLGLGLSDMQGFEENNIAYLYTAHGSFMNAWKINCSTVSATPSVKIDSFTATPPSIQNGGTSRLAWQTTSTFPTNVGRNYVTLNGEPVGEDGERTVDPKRTTNYTLKISRSEDSGAASADSCTAKAERFDDSPNRPKIFASGYINYISLFGTTIKKLMVGQNFGYTIASLINPSRPTVAGHDNMITAGGGGPIEKVGDGQSTIMELAVSPDGQRALVGWTDAESGAVFVLSPDGEIFKTVDQFGSYRPTGLGIVQRSDGKYFGFDLGHNYLFVKDITSTPGDGSYPSLTDSEVVVHPTNEVNAFARTAGHFFGYKINDDTGLGIIYAGAPYSGGSIANILKTFKVTPKDLGASAYTINNFTLVSAPNNPDIAYIFADLKDGLKGGPLAVATVNSSGVVTPLAGSPFIVPAPFTAGQLEHKSTIGFYNGSEPQATIIRGTVDSWGFINVKVSSTNLNISVATLPKASFSGSMGTTGWGDGKNTYLYAAQGVKVSTVAITCNNTGQTSTSNTCVAPNCDSATRVVTVSNDGGGGTGTGGDDDGTGRRSWFWWLKYYLNL